MKELTQQESQIFVSNKIWEKLSDIERAWFQLYQPYLSMPFSEFHRCMEELLDRPVMTHEFADPESLKLEAITKQKATFQQILDKIPRNKRVIAVITDENTDDWIRFYNTMPLDMVVALRAFWRKLLLHEKKWYRFTNRQKTIRILLRLVNTKTLMIPSLFLGLKWRRE